MGRRDFMRLSAMAGVTAAVAPSALSRVVWAAGPGLPGSRPFPSMPAGVPQPALAPELANIDHIVLLMNENHSFDAHFGMLGHRVASKAGLVDGYGALGPDGNPTIEQADDKGNLYRSFAVNDQCQLNGAARPQGPGNNQGWDGSHQEWDGGRMDGFVRADGQDALRYWDDQHDLGFLYSLAGYFPVGDRYFSSTLAPTYPNRVFALCGSAVGLDSTDTPPPDAVPPNGRIFDLLDQYGISWADYWTNLPSAGLLGQQWAASKAGTNFFGPHATIDGTLLEVEARLASNTLQSVVLIEQDFLFGDEEPPQSLLAGQNFLYRVVSLFLKYPAVWARTMIVINYDEGGGFYDHVPPVAVPNPGDGHHPGDFKTPARPANKWYGDDYTLTGFRVPNIVVSPWAKPNHVSHVFYDHTSVLRTIEYKWNLPALTQRDLAANPMLDYLVPNNGLSAGQAPFADPAAIQLVAAPPSTPTGNPDVDSNICDQNQAVLAAKYPPALSGPAAPPSPAPAAGATRPLPNTSGGDGTATAALALVAAGAAATGVSNAGRQMRKRSENSQPHHRIDMDHQSPDHPAPRRE
jgi:phospholipase C